MEQDRGVGNLKNGEIESYLEETPIGKIQLANGAGVQVDRHFEIAQQKIYQNVSVPAKSDPRYTDCDEGGRC